MCILYTYKKCVKENAIILDRTMARKWPPLKVNERYILRNTNVEERYTTIILDDNFYPNLNFQINQMNQNNNRFIHDEYSFFN